MLIKEKNGSVEEVLKYIYKDRFTNFYLYMDLQMCGCEGNEFDLWIKKKDRLEFVVYRYYDCLHLYGTVEKIDKEIVRLIQNQNPKVISGSVEIIESLSKMLEDVSFDIEYNHIVTADKYMEYTLTDNMKLYQAGNSVVPEIAALMMQSDIFSKVSTYDELVDSLKRRNDSGFGRLFVLEDAGEIVASNATYAETDEMEVVGGLITDTSKRGKGYGRIITAHTWNLIRDENKIGVAHLGEENTGTIVLHQKMGYSFIGRNARLLINY